MTFYPRLLFRALAAIAPGSTPVNTVPPVFTGTQNVGQTLTVTTGSWTNSPTSYTYQWQLALYEETNSVLTDAAGNPLGVPIVGATSSSYVLQIADQNQKVFCTVTAHNASGTGWADSNLSTTIVVGATAEAVAFLARAGSMDVAHTNAYTVLINSLVGVGIWPKLDALWILATDSEAHAMLNLVSASYPLVNHGTAWSFNYGMIGNVGSAAYLDTGFNPVTAVTPKFTLNSAHISVRINTNSSSTTGAMGASNPSNVTHIYPRYSVNGNAYCRINEDINSATTGPAVSDSFGLYVATRNSSTQDEGYKVLSGVTTTFHNAPSPSAALVNSSIVILGEKFNGNVGAGSDHAASSASIGSALTVTEVGQLSSLIDNYLATI